MTRAGVATMAAVVGSACLVLIVAYLVVRLVLVMVP